MTRTTFPIHDPDIPSVPWALMVPHGAASLVNYGLTLAQLADRGGVSPAEAVALIEDRPMAVMPTQVARDQLREYARGVSIPALSGTLNIDPDSVKIDGKPAVWNDDKGWSPAVTEALELARLMRDQNLHNRYHFNKLIALLERA